MSWLGRNPNVAWNELLKCDELEKPASTAAVVRSCPAASTVPARSIFAHSVNAGQDPRESTGVIDGRIADRKVCGLTYSHFE